MIKNIIYIIIGILIIFILGFYQGSKYKENELKDNLFNKYINNDTLYNKIILDSIEYNIIKKDSVITELKKYFEYEKEQVLNASDSVNVELFKQLAGSE